MLFWRSFLDSRDKYEEEEGRTVLASLSFWQACAKDIVVAMRQRENKKEHKLEWED